MTDATVQEMTIESAGRMLRAGAVTSVELTAAGFAAADRLDEVLGIYHARFDESALEAAASADSDFAAGIDRGPLQGIPIGVKDVVLSREAPTGAGSFVKCAAWEERRDARVVAALRDAGAVITGKLATMEFATGAPDHDGPWALSRTPWDPDYWAGGSSSGSASGVAAGVVLGAVGTDTGGSIRFPAAWCGVTGLKQTFGRVSQDGVIPLSTSLDVVGPLTRSAADAATMLQAMAGHAEGDPSTVDVAVPDFAERIGGSLAGLRIGVERENHLTHPDLDPAVGTAFEEAVKQLEQLGATVTEVVVPWYKEVAEACMVTFLSDALAYHHKHLAEQWDSYQRTTRLEYASAVLFSSGDYVRAQKVRRAARDQLARVFDGVDVVVAPTAVTPAPNATGPIDVPRTMAAICTPYWSTMGNPAVSIPMGFSGSLPVGLQIVGRHFDEAAVLGTADAYQRATDWHLRTPPLSATNSEEVRDV